MFCDRQNSSEFNQNFVGTNDVNMDVDINMINQTNNQGMAMPQMTQMGSVQRPIIEPGRERVINRTFLHEVPHVCPIRTRIINNHVFRHTFRPCFSCCQENTCTNIQCGSCNDF